MAAAAQDLHLLRDHLDVAGGELGVLAGPFPDGALHGDGGLLVDGLELGHHLRGFGHNLGGAVEVPEDDEGQLGAHLPDVLHPAGELDGLPRVGSAKLAAGVGAVLCHCCYFLSRLTVNLKIQRGINNKFITISNLSAGTAPRGKPPVPGGQGQIAVEHGGEIGLGADGNHQAARRLAAHQAVNVQGPGVPEGPESQQDQEAPDTPLFVLLPKCLHGLTPE